MHSQGWEFFPNSVLLEIFCPNTESLPFRVQSLSLLEFRAFLKYLHSCKYHDRTVGILAFLYPKLPFVRVPITGLNICCIPHGLTDHAIKLIILSQEVILLLSTNPFLNSDLLGNDFFRPRST